MREIKFRVFGQDKRMISYSELCSLRLSTIFQNTEGYHVMQYTGLKDKNGLAEIYEGDIIDSAGNIKGNIYESPQVYEKGVDCVIEGMGTKKWRDTESVAVGRGCQYAE